MMIKQEIQFEKIHQEIGTNIEVALPEERIRYDSKEYLEIAEKIRTMEDKVLLIAKQAQMSIANRLLWECDTISGVVYVDTEDPYQVEKPVTRMDRMLWDVQANKSETQASISGWLNSYNNQEFSREELEEYVENSRQKLIPYIHENTKVLEVGVGSGLLAFLLAPLCKRYDGCDISAFALEKLRSLSEKKGYDNISLYQCAADEISKLGKKYDIIVMSSVTEYFSGYNYMRKVVQSCVECLSDRGVILFADVFDLAKKKQYHNSVYRYAKQHPGCHYKRDFSHELFIPHEFWRDMDNTFPQISKAIISDKIGTYRNEINVFRYDVLFEVQNTVIKEKQDRGLYKYQFGVAI